MCRPISAEQPCSLPAWHSYRSQHRPCGTRSPDPQSRPPVQLLAGVLKVLQIPSPNQRLAQLSPRSLNGCFTNCNPGQVWAAAFLSTISGARNPLSGPTAPSLMRPFQFLLPTSRAPSLHCLISDGGPAVQRLQARRPLCISAPLQSMEMRQCL